MDDIPVIYPEVGTSSASKQGGPPQSERTDSSVTIPQVSVKHKQAKTARKQYSSCDACRLRKVKCIKKDDSCEGCIAKNVTCSNAFADAHASGKGKRIEQARQLCGTLVPTSGHIATPMISLNNAVMSSAALRALMDAYGKQLRDVLPNIDILRADRVCQSSHYDLSRLEGSSDYLLCLSIAATAALVQEPFSSNSQASSLALLDPLGTSLDLRTQAVAAADRQGLLRKPSLQSLQILRLLCLLHSGDNARSLKRSDDYRAFERTMVDHARILVEKGDLREPYISMFFWELVLLDSLACAVSGQAPSFTDDDIRNFAAFVDYTTEGMVSMISELTPDAADGGAGLLFAAICRILRRHYQEVSSAFARRRGRLDLSVLRDVLPEIARLEAVQEIYEGKLTALFGKPWPDHLEFWGKLAQHLYGHILVLSLIEVETALSAAQPGSPYFEQVHELYLSMSWVCIEKLVSTSSVDSPKHWQKTVGSVDQLISYLSVLRLRRLLKLLNEDSHISGAWRWSPALLARVVHSYLAYVEHLGRTVQAVRVELPELRLQVADYCANATAAKPLLDTQLLYNGHESSVCAAPPRTYPIVGTDPPESAAALVHSSTSSATTSPDHTNTLPWETDGGAGASLRALPTWLTNSAMYKDKDNDSIFDGFNFDALGPPPDL